MNKDYSVNHKIIAIYFLLFEAVHVTNLLVGIVGSSSISKTESDKILWWVYLSTQRLGDRIKQQVPSTIRNKAMPSRQQPRKQCRSELNISCDSAIAKHLLSNAHCAASYSDTKFKVLAKCRSLLQLRVMESIYIKNYSFSLPCKTNSFV